MSEEEAKAKALKPARNKKRAQAENKAIPRLGIPCHARDDEPCCDNKEVNDG